MQSKKQGVGGFFKHTALLSKHDEKDEDGVRIRGDDGFIFEVMPKLQ